MRARLGEVTENQPDRDRRGWLFRVAQHEAWVLDRATREHVGIRTSSFDPQPVTVVEPRGGDRFEMALDPDEAPSLLGELPERLRRIAMLRALGFGHSEIGELTGDSVTRVGQLVSRARFGIAEARAERAAAESPLPPRAQRLRELERNPPGWLIERIGRMPSGLRKRSDHAIRHRAWRRAALALDDYCRHAGAVRGDALAALRPIQRANVSAFAPWKRYRPAHYSLPDYCVSFRSC